MPNQEVSQEFWGGYSTCTAFQVLYKGEDLKEEEEDGRESCATNNSLSKGSGIGCMSERTRS